MKLVLFLLLQVFAIAGFAGPGQSESNPKPQILIPAVFENTADYVGDNWFALAISPKSKIGSITLGKVSFGKAYSKDEGSPAEFVTASGKKLPGDHFDYIYVRNIAGLKEGNYDLAHSGTCFGKSEKDKSVTCHIEFQSQKLTVTEEYLKFNERAGATDHKYTVKLKGVTKLVIESQNIVIAGDINHDGKLDLVFFNADVQSKTDFYSVSDNSDELLLVATALSNGC